LLKRRQIQKGEGKKRVEKATLKKSPVPRARERDGGPGKAKKEGFSDAGGGGGGRKGVKT